MRYRTVKDLVDDAAGLHEGLAAYYQRLSGTAEKEKVKMLLDYLARHEKSMAAMLARYGQESAGHIRNAWLKYELDSEFVKCIPPAKPVGQMDIPDIIDLAIQLDDCITDAYQLIAMQCELPEAKEAFAGLVAQERQEKMRMVRQAMNLQDL